MIVELIAVAGALGFSGLVAAWQHRVTRRRRALDPPPLSAQGPYRQGDSPGASASPETGGFPMPPPFGDEGWTPRAPTPKE